MVDKPSDSDLQTKDKAQNSDRTNGGNPKSDVNFGIRSAIPWLLLMCVAAGIYFARLQAPESDHALINILTAGLVFLGWIALIAACWTSNSLRGFAKLLFIGPFAALLLLIALFRFERLDSELIPQFRPRWQASEALPTKLEPSPTADGFFVSAETDFPQFLGPNRDGRLETEIQTDWEAYPLDIAWKQPIGDGWSGFVVQGDAAVTMEQRDASEWVSAYSVKDGGLLWKYEMQALHTTVPGGAGPRSTPAISDDRVYACSAVDAFVCLELQTGKELWRQDLLELADIDQAAFESSVAWGRSGSPLVVGKLVVVPFGGSGPQSETLIAFDAQSGEIAWKSGVGQISYSSPTLIQLDGVQQILLISEDKLAAYAPDDGKVLWEEPWPGKSSSNPAVPQPLPVDENRLLLCKGYGEGSKLIEVRQQNDGWNIETVWENKTVMKAKFSNPVLHDGFVYGLSDGILECVSLEDGERQWKRGRYRHGQLLLLSDMLLILSEAGELSLVPADPESYREVAKQQVIEGVSWNTMALSGERLLVRNSDEAACVLLPLQTGNENAMTMQ